MPLADKRAVLAHYTNFLEQARASADDDLIHCRTCGQNGPRCVSLERELVDGMNDRPATRQAFNISRCECGSDDVEDIVWCELCQVRPATEEGTEMCTFCFNENEGQQDANVKRARELQAELNQPFLPRLEKASA